MRFVTSIPILMMLSPFTLLALIGCSSSDDSAQILALESKLAKLEEKLSLIGTSNSSQHDEITTRKLKVVDQSGRIRCQISVNEQNATQLTLQTADGQVGVILGASDVSNGMVVNGWQGSGLDTSGITIAQNRKLGPSIAISHSNGQPAFSAQVINGASLLGMASSKVGSKPQIELRVGSEQESTLQLLDKKHVARAMIGVTSQNQPSVGLVDRRGIGRISLQMDKSDVPQLALHGNTGRMRGAIGMGSSNDVALFILDSNGKPKKVVK